MVPGRTADTDAAQTAWRAALLEIATRQLLDDGKISDKSEQIFQRLTVDGQSPELGNGSTGSCRIYGRGLCGIFRRQAGRLGMERQKGEGCAVFCQ